MKLSTIWSLPAMTTTERLRRTHDWAAFEVGAHLPLRVKYWVTMQMVGKATMTSPNVPATPLDEILKNLPRPKNMS